jgi:cell division septation protein DedD
MHIVESVRPTNSPSNSAYAPWEIKKAYGLPSSGGTGTTIAIIDAYNTTTIWNDLGNFSLEYSLPLPTSSNFEVVNLGGPPASGSNSGWATETCLDVEWAHAIAPNATILLVEAVSANSNDLLNAVQYAANYPNVVAISMSWGGPEYAGEISDDSYFTSSNGAVFFASSGDSGAYTGSATQQEGWPACSPNVVAVGGTVLNLNSEGAFISETAWSGSGGGVSVYEPQPSYQSGYGLTYPRRAVPDVSYNAGAGVSVYSTSNDGWISVGGTSAGAPQWAAIQADGLSATSANLYGRAKSAYSSYFRDITSGSSSGSPGQSAKVGYDLVTGLGSPLTDDFDLPLTVSPSNGPGNAEVTVNGSNVNVGDSISISYINPITFSRVPIINNLQATSPNFNYTFNAPDLQQNNLLNDNSPLSDNIVFKAIDNSNGNSYTTSIPYTEWRRGLTQVGNATAAGLFGNSTDLSTTVFVQNDQSLVVAGDWFSPGNATFLWDNTANLGTAPIDGTGTFNATVIVPTTTAGPHTLTVIDQDSSFCVNVTRLPTVADDYDGSWHTADFTINLTPDYNGTETYYMINGGSVENVSADGQPLITMEGANNTLEYWSTWNVYGTGLVNLTAVPVTLTGIELDMTPPQGSIQINGGASTTDSTAVTITVNATDPISGVSQMRFSNEDTWDQAVWIPYTNISSWQLTSGDGAKTVYCQIIDNAGLITELNESITLSTTQPMASSSPEATSTPQPSPSSSPSPAPSPTASPAPTASPSASPPASPTPSISPSPTPSPATQAPELSIQMVLAMIALLTILSAVSCIRKMRKMP